MDNKLHFTNDFIKVSKISLNNITFRKMNKPTKQNNNIMYRAEW